jgi:hypothetical protein
MQHVEAAHPVVAGVHVAGFHHRDFEIDGLDCRPGSGLKIWEGPDGSPLIKVIREGIYQELYDDAIFRALPGPDGFPVASPEHLAAMKLAIHDLRHRLDLKWLLGKPGLVSRVILKNIVRDFLGGRFALDALEVIEEEVELDIAMEKDRDGSSYP